MKTETQNYKPLVAGDTYQQGDETKHKQPGPSWSEDHQSRNWTNVASGMFGHKVLPADLIAAEFRRKV